jgi:hypothetical protein
MNLLIDCLIRATCFVGVLSLIYVVLTMPNKKSKIKE